jgi:hypothetical protein
VTGWLTGTNTAPLFVTIMSVSALAVIGALACSGASRRPSLPNRRDCQPTCCSGEDVSAHIHGSTW